MELRDAQFLICITCPSQATAIIQSLNVCTKRLYLTSSPLNHHFPL